jgi:hypothetical protein
LYDLIVTGKTIYILADVLTAMTQTYNGSVLIGNASFLGKTPTVGFLLGQYRNYFEYANNGRSSVIDYLNLNPIYIRTLISEDPEITFNGTVNDIVANTHTLLVAAIAPEVPANNSNDINRAAMINFNKSVGEKSPLYSLNVQTVLSDDPQLVTSLSHVGSISQIGNIATYYSQYYRANMLTAQAAVGSNQVVYSIRNPEGFIGMDLPLQTFANSGCTNCGQINHQNTNDRGDTKRFKGETNDKGGQANSNNENPWGKQFNDPALDFIPPRDRSNGEFMNFAKFIQRDVQHRMTKQLDEDGDDERKPTVRVGDAQVDGGTVDCSALRKEPKTVLPLECRTTRD